jgi:hypothetical protein
MFVNTRISGSLGCNTMQFGNYHIFHAKMMNDQSDEDVNGFLQHTCPHGYIVFQYVRFHTLVMFLSTFVKV